MKRQQYLRVCGLIVGAGMLGGCDSARPSPNVTSQKESQQSVVSPPLLSQRPDQTQSKQSVAAAHSWQLDPPKSVTTAMVAAPRDPGAMFAHYCSVCHGPEGRGDGQYYSDDLASKPANLTDGEVMTALTDEHLTSVITGGSTAVGKSPLCPPWGRVFSKEQVAELVIHLRKLPSQAAKASDDVESPQATP